MVVTFLCQNTVFCASEKISALRVPLYFDDPAKDSNKETFLNSKGETFDEVWERMNFKKEIDLKALSIDPEEEEFAREYAQMSLEELENVLKDLTDSNIILWNSKKLLLAVKPFTKYPLLTAFINLLSSSKSQMEHYYKMPLVVISVNKSVLPDTRITSREKDMFEEYLRGGHQYKCFMREIARRWRKPETDAVVLEDFSNSPRYPCLLFASKASESIKSNSPISDIPKPSNVEYDTDKHGNTWVFQRDEDIYLEIDKEGAIEVREKYDLARAMYEFIEVDRKDGAFKMETLNIDSDKSVLGITVYDSFVADGSHKLIAVINPKNSEIIGYAVCTQTGLPGEIYLEKIFVKLKYRRKGIAFLLSEYSTRQFDRVSVGVVSDYEEGIVEMYKKRLGFKALEDDPKTLIWERSEQREGVKIAPEEDKKLNTIKRELDQIRRGL